MKATISISRPQYGDDRKKIKITVRDPHARIRFLDLEIGLSEFAECITGLSERDCDISTRGLDKIGKIRETKDLIFEIPRASYHMTNTELESIAKSNTPDGWECSNYFGSKDSFFQKGDQHFAKTTINKWTKI
ncbi:MAG: hypothetical protein ACTSWD_11715 [Candidatus Heimdallarchaeota archaeon]